MYIPLSTMQLFLSEFEKRLSSYSAKVYRSPDRLTYVYSLDDSLIILAQFIEYEAHLCSNADRMYAGFQNNPYLDFPIEGQMYYTLHIEELTPNYIGFQYNNARFVREMEALTNIRPLSGEITFTKFTSDRQAFWYNRFPEGNNDVNKRIDSLFPELKLSERCAAWEGTHYFFIVLEFEDISGTIHRACASTTKMPHSYVIEVCKAWIQTGQLKGRAISTGFIERDMASAFASWKGMRRQKRLEEHLKYFYIEKNIKSLGELYKNTREILDNANSGVYEQVERSTYLRPVNKWVSEELVYKIANNYYGKRYSVIYQHRPFFLRSQKDGQMSYDIFISGINVAIEYQGKQHFEPVDYFGGQDAFEELRKRDRLKARLSVENGIKLVYINYWEEITKSLIIDRVGVELD